MAARAPVLCLASCSLALLAWPSEAAAEGPCDCNHVIEPGTPTVTGTELGVMPGDTVCVRGGAREFLRLYEFVGSPDQWIEVRNCEGVVEIDNEDRGYGLTLDGSRYVRITGTGDDEHTYGFRIRAARDGPDYSASGVVVAGLSSDYELDHMEVYETGFAGFNLKTEPTCDGSANLGNFIQYDTRVHHNWIHDTIGEGIYFGSTGYGGRDYTCEGETVTLYPHEHHGADIHHNLIERTGWDGMQVGVTPVDCYVWANTIRDVGLEGVEYQQQGMQIGGASACEIWANRLERGPTNGIFILTAAETDVHDNLVVDFAGTGIYANTNQLPELDGLGYRFVHNTVLRSGRWGIAVFGPNLGPSLGWNNIILESTDGDLAPAGDVDFDAQANITDMSIDELGFVDPEGGDYHLDADSPAVGAGVAAGEYSSHDLDGVERDTDAPDAGAFEYTTEPPPSGEEAGSTSTSTGGGSSSGASGSGGSEEGETGDAGLAGGEGCGCTAGASEGDRRDAGPRSLALVALLLAATGRRTRTSRRRKPRR